MAIVTTDPHLIGKVQDHLHHLMRQELEAHYNTQVPNTKRGEKLLHEALEAAAWAPHSSRHDENPRRIGREVINLSFRFEVHEDQGKAEGVCSPIMQYSTNQTVGKNPRLPVIVPINMPTPFADNAIVIGREQSNNELDAYLARIVEFDRRVDEIETEYNEIEHQLNGLLNWFPTFNLALEAFPEIGPFLTAGIREILDEVEESKDDLPLDFFPDKELFIRKAAAIQILRLEEK